MHLRAQVTANITLPSRLQQRLSNPMNTSSATPSPIWRRIAALVYDTLILLAISFMYGATLTAIAVKSGHEPEGYQPMFSSPLFLLGWLFCLISFYCWFWHKSGQTLGMRTWRIKLVQNTVGASPPTWKQCILRSIISPMVILCLGIGYWYQWLNKDQLSLHDKLTGTRVIVIKK